MIAPLRAPFPWFGGKSLAASLIWERFGNVPNYVEPFAGSLAVLLARPGGAGKVETANDLDGLIANFWRATADQPEAQVPDLTEKLRADPEYSDPIAGWWVWGISCWIGNGWCHPDIRLSLQRPSLGNARGSGVAAIGHRSRNLPMIGAPGNGVHAPSRKKPLTHRNKGVHRNGHAGLEAVFGGLAERLRGVRVCCGDWKRVLGRSTLGIDTAHGMTPCAVLLDPPYASDLRHKQTSSSKTRAKERIWFSPHCLRPEGVFGGSDPT